MLTAAILISLVGLALGRTCSCGATRGGGAVNVRSCASTSCGVVGSISSGDCHDFTSLSGAWHQLTFEGQIAYAHGDYLSGPQPCGGLGNGLCTGNLCSSFASNQQRTCDSFGCGNYGASRGTRTHTGWDIRCNRGARVFAPFDGTLVRKARPYGNGSCCDTGLLLTGSGTWAGHSVMMFYCEPLVNLIGQQISKGQHIADHVGLHCGCYGTGMTDHVHFQMDVRGVRIDPASYLFC